MVPHDSCLYWIYFITNSSKHYKKKSRKSRCSNGPKRKEFLLGTSCFAKMANICRSVPTALAVRLFSVGLLRRDGLVHGTNHANVIRYFWSSFILTEILNELIFIVSAYEKWTHMCTSPWASNKLVCVIDYRFEERKKFRELRVEIGVIDRSWLPLTQNPIQSSSPRNAILM
jgi:hypothetical protein